MAGVDPRDRVGEAAGVPPVDGMDMLPLLTGANATSPRTEIFFGVEALLQGDWKLLTGGATSASWPGPTYPNASTAATNNTLNLYTAPCSWEAPCLYNVADDRTEHHDQAQANPDLVYSMRNRSAVLQQGIWDDKWTGYSANCGDWKKLYNNFIGPWCDLGPSPPAPPPAPPAPAPGPFPPTPLSNCTYLPDTWVSPASHSVVHNATTQAACCSACGMSTTCVASVLTCPVHGHGHGP